MLAEVVRHLLSKSEFAFVLTGKFETDELESRFGQYRLMCGGNRLVSIKEVMEKKLNIRSLLHLHSTAGSIPVKMFFSEISYTGAADQFSDFCDQLQFSIQRSRI